MQSSQSRDRSPLHASQYRDRSPLHSSQYRDRSPIASPPGTPTSSRANANPPTPTTPGTPSGSTYNNYIGFICLVGELRTSYGGNRYRDMNLKVGSDDYLKIRVMHAENEPVLSLSKENVVKLMEVGTRNNTLFFNRKFKSYHQVQNYGLEFDGTLPLTHISAITLQMTQVHIAAHLFWIDHTNQTSNTGGTFRNAVCKEDGGEEIRLTVWGKALINELCEEDGEHLVLSCLKVQNYQGVKLATTSSTVACLEKKDKITPPLLDDYREKKDLTVLVNPSIDAVSIESTHKCVACLSPVNLEQNNMFVKCGEGNCRKRFLKTKVIKETTGALDVKLDDKSDIISVTFVSDDILNIIEPLDSTDMMEEKLLMLDQNCRLTYENKDKKLVKIETEEWMDQVPPQALHGDSNNNSNNINDQDNNNNNNQDNNHNNNNTNEVDNDGDSVGDSD